jgi:glycine/D-amino acid oxidase-like deaminating enzyme
MTTFSRPHSSTTRPVERTVWWASAPPGPACPALDESIDVDIAIVGAGFVGLAAAWHLARAGQSVAVLEAGEPGEGASGLNAGFVVPNFAKADPDAVIARLGQDAGTRLLQAVGASADTVFAIVRENALSCEAEQVGWMHVAHAPDAVPMLRARAARWQALGRPLRFLDQDEARALTGARQCHGALLDPSGGMLNPLGLARGLAGLAAAAGARIYGRTPVTGIRREKGVWRLAAAKHEVTARRVALCTNAFATGAAAALGRTIVPLQVYQIATEPLPDGIVAAVSPRRIPLADTRANLFTARLTSDNRLVSGGMSVLPFRAEGRMSRAIALRLARELDLPAIPRVDFVWRGTAAMTPDFMPRIVRLADGLSGAIGCNGRGVALTQVVAHALAETMLEPGKPTVVPEVAGNALPLRPIAPIAASLAVLQVRLKDVLTRLG